MITENFIKVKGGFILSRIHVIFSLTVHEVNTSLDAMAKANLEKNRDAVKREIHNLIRNMSALEQVNIMENYSISMLGARVDENSRQ